MPPTALARAKSRVHVRPSCQVEGIPSAFAQGRSHHLEQWRWAVAPTLGVNLVWLTV